MHFFKNSVSFIAVMCVFGAACAAVAPGRGRVGVVGMSGAASRRLPSLINIMRPGTGSTGTTTGTTTTTTTTSTDVPLISDTECVDQYRKCMKGPDACGTNFEECTNNVLFHGHMGECFSTLYQCSDSGLESLFGSGATIDTIGEGNEDPTTHEMSYDFPTAGSVMGMDIAGAAIRNKLSTSECVKSYKKCLNKDTICGEDFELCTSVDEFKTQAPMCDSILSRCQSEGYQQLFGQSQVTKPSLATLSEIPAAGATAADGAVKQWIEAGAALAAANAVNTCYKVIDSCFVNACKKNPYRCLEGANSAVVNAADLIAEPGATTGATGTTESTDLDGVQSAAQVRKFFRSACESTIGGNKYCFMTFKTSADGTPLGRAPKKSELLDPENQEDVFGEAYSARKSILAGKVQGIVNSFNKSAQDKCIETFKSCSVTSCGGGSGAACYASVFHADTGAPYSINRGAAYQKVAQGCAGVVNTNPSCIYMGAVQDVESGGYEFSSFAANEASAFNVLFPQWQTDGDENKAIVAVLNGELSAAYNDVAIAQMKKECQTYVENCAKSMCGKNYQNCYRNRTDIFASTYSSDDEKFNKSMNQMGGVLDYTIVQGLCGSSVRNSDICAESLAMSKAGLDNSDNSLGGITGWGNSTTVANAWRRSGNMAASSTGKVQDMDENGKRLCECDGGVIDVCAYESGATNTTCNKAHYVDRSSLLEKTAIATLFQDVLDLVEKEAQAQYKAKLTKEQNICLAQNKNALPDATYVWAKLTNGMPTEYATKGLGSDSVASNDLYNSFCRVKVKVYSDDPDIEKLIEGKDVSYDNQTTNGLGITKKATGTVDGGSNEQYAYFAAGDAFTCGSWLSDSKLDALSEKIKADARKDAGQGSQHDKNVRLWSSLGAAVVGGGLAGFGYDKLQNSDSLGGLFNKNKYRADQANSCKELVVQAREKYTSAIANVNDGTDGHVKSDEEMKEAIRLANQAKSKLQSSMKKKEGEVEVNIPSSIVAIKNIKDDMSKPLTREVPAEEGIPAVCGPDQDQWEKILNAYSNVNALCSQGADNNPQGYTNGCMPALQRVQSAMSDVRSQESLYTETNKDKSIDISGIVTNLKQALDGCKMFGNWANKDKTLGDRYSKNKGGFKTAVDNAVTQVDALTLNVRCTDGKAAVEAKPATYAQMTIWYYGKQDITAMSNAMAELEDQCGVRAEDYDLGSKRTRVIGDVIAGAVGATATGLLTAGIVSSVQKAKYEEAENAALKEWMDTVGKKIHCSVNGTYLGDFKDEIVIDIVD